MAGYGVRFSYQIRCMACVSLWPVFLDTSHDQEANIYPCSISIAVIYLLASRTSWLSNDPILWFTMMFMPTGPPAMKLTALADVNGSNQEEKLSIAKFLTVSVPVLLDFSLLCRLRTWFANPHVMFADRLHVESGHLLRGCR